MSEGTVNFCYFREVAGEEPEAYINLLRMIMDQQQESLASLQSAIRQKDYLSLEITAHKMKAIAAMMSLTDQRRLLGELEAAASTHHSITKVKQFVTELEQLWKRSVREVQAELAKQKYISAPSTPAED